MHGQPLVARRTRRYPLALRSPAPYSRSKAMAEQVVLEEGRGALEAMIVRPRFVWGRGDTTLLPVLVEGTRSGALPLGRRRPPPAPRPRTSTTPSRASCAPPSTAAAAAPTSSPTATRLPFRDFVGELIAHPGRRRRRRAASPRRSPARSPPRAETAWKLLPLRGAPPLTRFALLGRLAGVHDRRHARPQRARLRAGRDARARACASCATPSSVLGRRREPLELERSSARLAVLARARAAARTGTAASSTGAPASRAQPPQVRALRARALVLGERGAHGAERLGLEAVGGGGAQRLAPRPA